ncbi:allantoate amidohydrolase [Paenarthrobacter aurescens]|uniref:Zn-dependent hydrolase n=1 Tax=Paenarthrobacter aurescens TaxID=43663 RepID=A0A4Y3NCI8_PAEAU|nr:allantoate amidohydrolase [Paenarthrobacter aurescens]MDO6145309.1 allantoate amidohydrolase [Paenarthrobacter aurescens]MDO6149114.1 allantoate amidohydrolase [Paenarthrobacter aurescens]MDO6160358.1 allantoate amidohydrolase [Paenarthrobacter aurescens]MDO6164217.1 allantoate amidohydrolase [Paenarthrobacter aurescens]GEB19664.1 Zn-dependent hydrolase [Paenarthrobacter aurescens]
MESVNQLLASIQDVGRDAVRGGYSRAVYTTPEHDLRQWFIEQAAQRGLEVETDRNGIIWAWWGKPQKGALVTGSHLDSVPGGGAFDGPLGVASALAAVDILKARGVQPARSLAVTVFPEEEGSRFGVACLGSRLLTGAIDVHKALNLRDINGDSFADVASANGLDPRYIGPDPEAMARIGEFVELHVEQGKGLGQDGPAVAVGSSILGHGRWKISISGQGNHAGTTLMTDRADPMVAAAQIIVAVRDTAATQPDARATVGRLTPVPGGTNVIASRVDLWLDARHPDDAVTAHLIERIYGTAQDIAAAEGCSVTLTEESYSDTVHFDTDLSRRITGLLPGAPVLATGAGHDAGVLAGYVPSAMVFVRNPSGISHSPEEYVADEDASAGAIALADVVEGLL